MISRRRLATATLFVLASSTSTTARAADGAAVSPTAAAEARQQYEAGMRALSERHYLEAAIHFEGAGTRAPHGASYYMAAIAWEQGSRPDRAADAYARALQLPGLDEVANERAKDRVRELEKLLGTLSVTGPDGWRVQLDGQLDVPLPARVHGLPGVHSLHMQAPGRPTAKREVSLSASSTTELELTDTDVPVPTGPTAPAPPKIVKIEVVREVPPPGNTRRIVGAGVGGLGVATMIGAVVTGVSALGARDAYQSSRTQDAYDHVRALQTTTNVLWITGGALAITGAALYFWPAKSAPKTALTIGAGGLGGSF